MKIHITEHIDKAMGGFTIVPIVYGEVDFNSIPDNAGDTIIAIDAVDSIKPQNISSFISLLSRKMRLNSTLYLGGTDIFAVSRQLLSGNINVDEYNAIISGKNGIYSVKYILNLLKDNDVNVHLSVFKGYNYEITATRSNNQN